MIVSLCMIAYNEAEAIEGLFSDISLQEYPHEKIEIVFVDSMSTDSTYERMEEFRNTDYGFLDVKIVQCAKRNQAFSWNAALMTATGDVIIRVDAHARIPRNFVSRNVYNLKQGENVVGGGRPNISSNVSSWKLTLLAAEDSPHTAVPRRRRSIWTASSTPPTGERSSRRSAASMRTSDAPRTTSSITA